MKLILGDCLEEMKKMPDKSVDLILCDLPYGTTACKWDIIIPFKPMWEECYRILRPNGFIVLTASQPFTTKLIYGNIDNFSHQWIWQKDQGSNPLLANIMPMKNFEDVIVFSNEYKPYDYELKNPLRKYFYDILVFLGKTYKQIEKELGHRKAEHTFYVIPKKHLIDKIGQKIDHTLRFGSTQFGLCTKKTYNELLDAYNLKQEKFILSYCELEKINKEFEKTLPDYPRVYNPQKIKGKKYKSGDGFLQHTGTFKDGGIISEERYPTSIIKFSTDKSKSLHPTQKPVALMEYLIKTYTNEGDTVLDFAMGSGTTGVACKELGRDFIGIEINKEYYDIAVNRINQTMESLF